MDGKTSEQLTFTSSSLYVPDYDEVHHAPSFSTERHDVTSSSSSSSDGSSATTASSDIDSVELWLDRGGSSSDDLMDQHSCSGLDDDDDIHEDEHDLGLFLQETFDLFHSSIGDLDGIDV